MSSGGSIADVFAGRAQWALGPCDGFALAAMLGDGAVDHVIGDPPFDEKTHNGAITTERGVSVSAGIDFATLPPPHTFVPALTRVSRRWVVLFCAMEQLGIYASAAGSEQWIRSGYWSKTNRMPQRTGDRPAQPGEALAIMHRKGMKRWNGNGKAAEWAGPKDADPRRIHPTKKPLWLMEALIRDFTDPGEIVFDPTAGEGTTGEACMRLGRRFIGCEIDPKYHAAGMARIARAASGMKQTEMFG